MGETVVRSSVGGVYRVLCIFPCLRVSQQLGTPDRNKTTLVVSRLNRGRSLTEQGAVPDRNKTTLVV